MYTITRGPSKLTTQRRTGPKQQIDSKLQELKNKQQLLIPNTSNGWDSLPSSQMGVTDTSSQKTTALNAPPKLVFNRVNGKRSQTPVPELEREVYTLAHEENVRFIYQAWQDVKHQMEEPQQSRCPPQQYQDQSPDTHLKNFVPIDLDEWWAERFLANIENCA